MKTKRILHELSEFPVPDTLEQEKQIISDIIQSPDMFNDVAQIVKPSMFANEQCLDTWMKLTEMNNSGDAINLPTVATKVKKEFIMGLIEKMSGYGPVAVLGHAKDLYDASARLKSYYCGVEMIKDASNEATTVTTILESVKELENTLINDSANDSDNVNIADSLNMLSETLEKNQIDRAQGKDVRITTGFPKLDWLTYGGFSKGQLVILSARPSVGKTALMLYMAKGAARNNFPVNIYSLEMTNEELSQRLLFSTGYVSPKEVASANVDWNKVELANRELASLPIFINDSATEINSICSRIETAVKRGRCKIAFIDYLGLIDVISTRNNTVAQEVGMVTKQLKHLAKRCGIPIVLLSQLNRASASENRPPQLFDLRDSGSIEQDADAVLMLERPDTGEDEAMQINMWVRKWRNGKAGNICLKLRPDDTYTNFYEIEN